jgi:6-phosphogluconolactonase
MPKQRLVFVGTYTEPILFGSGKILEGKGRGIYAFWLDASTGSLEPCGLTEAGRPNPSFLTVHPSGRFLYAVNELKEFEGAFGGAVSAFGMDPDTGELGFLNRKATHGTDPCHLIVDRTGKYVLVANFMSGSVCVLPVQEDGSLGDATDVVQHQGASVDPARQAGPHAHAAVQDNSGGYVFVPELGLDRVMIYRLDTSRGKLEPNDVPWVEVTPGAGPRQIVFHPGGGYAYVINELDSTMMAFRYDGDRGSLQEIQTLSTLPEGFTGASTCAEVQISPSGKFLYGSNRGHDSIVIYAIDETDGMLTCVGHESTQGSIPRHFAVSPDGEFLLAANQDTDNLVTFRIDPGSGTLTATGHSVHVPTPVCVRVM